MNKRSFLALIVLLAFAAGMMGCSPSATREFSAVNVVKYGGRTMKSKIYFAGDKWRTESTVYGKKSIAIMRLDKKMMWILMPDQKTYMEQALSADDTLGRTAKLPGEFERKKVGSDTVNGVACDKFKVTYRPDKQSKATSVYQWISKDNIPVKTAAINGSWYSEYKNIEKGKQPASLFELPAGYKKFSMPKMPF